MSSIRITDLRVYTITKLEQMENIDKRTIRFVTHEKINNVIECKTKDKATIRIFPMVGNVPKWTNLEANLKRAVELAEVNGERFFSGVGYVGIDRIISSLKKQKRVQIPVSVKK